MKISIVSTYPPRPCGIGTFSADCREAILLADPTVEVNVVSLVTDEARAIPASPGHPSGTAMVSSALRNHPPEVTASLRQHVREDYAAAARMLSGDGTDVVLVEHEYGIFGGDAGEYILSLVAALTQPVVVTLHTVLSRPDPVQARTLRALCDRASLVTVFTETARRMIVEGGIVDAARVRVVPHGAPMVLLASELAVAADGTGGSHRVVTPNAAALSLDAALRRQIQGRTVLSTFGLISAGKGIELAIDAVARIVPAHPDVLYLIAGQTHPEVVKNEGEAYRRQLEAQVQALGLEQHVHFLDQFLAIDELALLLASTDLYLTPYRSREQIVSGALTFAVAAGCPVVSTPYLYAEDLLSTGGGVVVPFDDPEAMAHAVTDLLDSPAKLAAMRAEARRIGDGLSWPRVGELTLATLTEAAAGSRPVASTPAEPLVVRPDHLLGLIDDVGIIQHADGVVPRLESGYCVDDVARTVVVALQLGDRLPGRSAARMMRSGLALLGFAFDPTVPGLHNFLGYDRRWSDEAGTGDHVGRAAWALGEVVAAAPHSGEARPALRQLEALGGLLAEIRSPRAVALALLGLVRPDPELLPAVLRDLTVEMADRLAGWFDGQADAGWTWLEPYLTYDNARLPQAMIAAGVRLDRPDLVDRGRRALDWYADQCGLGSGVVRLIGNDWQQRSGRRSSGDEQPLDAAALVEAALEAYRATGEESYADLAAASFGWFLGRNRLGLPVYDALSGGCHDGLVADGVNDNEGAESTLAFWQALIAVEQAGRQTFVIHHDTNA